MTLCWVSSGDHYIILCEGCHDLLFSPPGSGNA
jgi:hypothetical protein